MATYSRPGTFVNQSLTPLITSPGVGTGAAIACFAGAFNQGPTQPTLVTSFQMFVNLFGGFATANGSDLVYAVYQYFNNGGSACYIYRVPNTDAVVASLGVGSVQQDVVSAPAAPTVTPASTGGTVAAGTYLVKVTYVDSSGETTASASASVTTTGSTSTITITSPVSATGATSWYAYVSQAGGSTYTRQQTLGSATALGTPLVLSAPPTSNGAAPPVANTTGSENASLLTFTASSPGTWANKLYVEIVPGAPASTADPTSVFSVNVYKGGTSQSSLVEIWESVSLNPASSRSLLAMMNATNGGSNYLRVTASFTSGYVAGDGSSDPIGNAGSPVALTGGVDGSAAPSLDTAITSGIASPEGAPHAWSCPGLGVLTNLILNLNLPAITDQSTLNNVISWAQSQGNVFVIVDAPFGGVPLVPSSVLVNTYQQFVSGAGTALNAAPCAAVYGPWLSIADPASSSSTATRWTAPGGAILGVWARSDAQYNVAQTPAGTTATVSAAALEAYFTPTDLNTLTTMQVNPIKLVPNAGFCVFGGRTLATGYPNRYINVARTLMQFTIDFVNITQFAIFQNNDERLWQSISTVLTSYLMQAMQANMLAGTTPETSYAVVCDGTTTSQAQAQAGLVNATVAVALVSPAEFIIINLSQMQGGGSATVSS